MGHISFAVSLTFAIMIRSNAGLTEAVKACNFSRLARPGFVKFLSKTQVQEVDRSCV